MIVYKYLSIVFYISRVTNFFLLVSCSSSIAKPQTAATRSNQTTNNQPESVDDILKDTIHLLDGLDKKLFQVNNQTRNALMRDNLRSLELDQLSSKDDDELTRIAENFSPERQRLQANNYGDTMSAQATNDYKSIVETQEGEPQMLAQVLGASKKFRQLNSAVNASARFDHDFTERHIQFSLDLMQALFTSNTHDSSGKRNNNRLESFLISPVSIQVVLMMMHLGARGQTKRELANCLHLPLPFDGSAGVGSASEQSIPVTTTASIQGNKLRRRNPQQQQQQHKQNAISNNVHELFGAAMKNLLKDPAVVKALTSANQIFLQRELNLLTPYEQAVRHYYSVDLKSVDFQQQQATKTANLNSTMTNTTNARLHEEQPVQQLINDWVERQTRGKISNFLQSPVPSSTLLMAINVLFFKGDWQYKFDPADTDSDAWFTLADGKTVKLPMMVNHLPLAYAYDPAMKTSVIELPYKAQRLGLFVLLPDETNGIFNLMQQLNSTTFANLISMMRKSAPTTANGADIGTGLAGINVRIPKFTIESSPRLSQILSKQLGLKSLFSPDIADLSGMFGRTPASGIQNSQRRSSSSSNSTSITPTHVGLDELMHKAILQVHEQGSVAAAASATIVERVGLFNGQYFEADHPFLIFLMDKQTGLVLFSGVFAGPANKADGDDQSAPVHGGNS